MRKRVRIALAVLLVAIVGVVAFELLRPQEREPVYQGNPSEYPGQRDDGERGVCDWRPIRLRSSASAVG
jgi:hypothetical protein